MSTTTHTITLTTIECADCSMTFGVPTEFQRQRRRDHKPFWCPAGDYNYYPDKSDLEQLQQRLDDAKTRADVRLEWARREEDRRKTAERSAAAHKGVATRIKNRIANGVCPACNRQFADLHAHMDSQHPDYTTTD